MSIHSVKDAKENAFATVAGGEGANGADASVHLDKEPFDHISGAEAFPLCLARVTEGQQLFQTHL